MRFRTGALVAALALALPTSAAAAPGWLAPTNIATEGPTTGVQTAIDGEGNVIVVWQYLLSDQYANQVVEAVSRPAGGSFSAPVTLGEYGSDPQLALDAAGNATVAWQSTDAKSNPGAIQVATRPAGGEFGAPVDLGVGNRYAHPVLDVDAAGDAVVAWNGYDDGDLVVHAAIRPAGGQFGPTADLSEPVPDGVSWNPQPAIGGDDAGDVVVAWDRNDGDHLEVQTASRPAGGEFGPTVDVSKPNKDGNNDALAPAVAVDGAGNATIVWSAGIGIRGGVAQAVTRPAGGSFGDPVDLSAPTGYANRPQVAFDDEGNAVVAWARDGGTHTTVQAVDRPAGGSFGTPVAVSVLGQEGYSPEIGVDGARNLTIVWHNEAGIDTIEASTRPAGGSFGAPVTVAVPTAYSPFGYTPDFAVDSDGDGVAAWPAAAAVSVAGYDATAPRVTALQAPGGGTAGVPVAFSAAATDGWSPVTLTWSFGDGARATGDHVSHVYAKAGSYTVTLTATDAVGHATTSSTVVPIKPGPSVKPPPILPPPVKPPPSGHEHAGRVALTRLGMSHRRFVRSHDSTEQTATVSRRHPATGTTIHYRLSRAAKVTMRIQRVRPGRRNGGRCVKPTRGLRGHRHCARYVTLTTLRRTHGSGGLKHVAFSGQIGDRGLPTGHYRLSATAAAGRGTTSKSRTLRFQIVHR